MDNPADVSGLTGRGLKIGDDAGQTPAAVAQFRLNEGWRALQRELDRVGVDPTAGIRRGDFTTEDLADAVCQAVMRVLRNPHGLVEESAALDDYRESRKHGDTTEDLYFTAAELRRLGVVLTVPNAGSFKYSS